jgi:poly(A) polymerase
VRVDLGDLSPLTGDIAEFFRGRGIQAWGTGGFLRDAVLGRRAHDIDVAIAGAPLSLGPELAGALGGHFFPLQEERGQGRITLQQRRIHIDLMPLRAADIESDLQLRDFTVDAMAALLDSLGGEFTLIDPKGGLPDLRRRVIRMTAEQAFVDDPLRLLRGPRIATELGFAIEPVTEAAIQRRAATLASAAPERRRDEIMRICATTAAGAGFRLLDTLGLFAVLFPEMEAARGFEQPKEHYFDVLGHSFAAVEALDWLMAEQRPSTSPQDEMWQELWDELSWCNGLRDYFREELAPGTARVALLKLGGLLHDIAKPQTRTFEESGRMRFFGHSDEGAVAASRLMRRLRFSARETKLVAAMIEAHLRPVQLGQQGPPSRRAVYRFFRDTKDSGTDTLFLSLADHLGSVGPRVSREGFRRHVALTSYILRLQFEEEESIAPRLVDGDVLMAALGLQPGPVLGELLEAIREAQAAGEVSTADQAIALARSRLADARALRAE